MLRVTDQYFWNFIFGIFFIILMIMGTIILTTEARLSYAELTPVDYILIILATWRLTRLFVYDVVTKWLREQFYDLKKTGRSYELVQPPAGPRRTLVDLMSCPWCFGVWAGATVTFFYLLTPYAIFPVIVLAVSGVATFLQLLANLVGHQAEKIKRENDGQ